MELIRVEEVSFAYLPGKLVLDRVTLRFDHRSTAIIGQNGAGKTTLVKLMKGLLKPFDGEILIGDLSVKKVTAASLAKRIGLVFQNPNDQIFKGNVLEEVMFGLLNIGVEREEARVRAIRALEMVELEGKRDMNPHDLSLSQKKLVSIAAVVAMDPEIIIFDEPTIAQDHAGKERIKEIIRYLDEKGKMVMTIIHDMDFVAECFERTVVMNRGRVLLDGPTREVFSREEVLKEAYLELPTVAQLSKRLGLSETFLTPKEFIAHLEGRIKG
ncbi:MAG: hypothetical protein BSOLF_1419 [Candidatus Carbobacillus altaicus]|uniref:ABC transporter domain-containing protein n=1 Tax=Candidatus Carbonibacillus altaicus TaxID=2163959 RepID=A0A2R6XZI7_9BACL|nr:MAG: hypothetical protein BSOLF_1419 [Candidatus Carbobacillus altaicus]